MKQFKLIGYPIEHSLSPWIHQKLLERAGLKGNYERFEITPEESFDRKIKELKEQKVDGFNVTVPYKQKIIPYLDDLDRVAKEMNAVNTVRLHDGKWTGYNTDGIGYVRSVTGAYPDLLDQPELNVLILGAGGAARAIYYALSRYGVANIDIANRTLEKAKDIANLKGKGTQTTVYSIDEAAARLAHYDFIIQTTSVGMTSVDSGSIIDIQTLKPGAVVSDIVYQPIKTRFLKDAEEHGAQLLLGHTMLLYQAQYSFEIWTNQRVDVTDMEEELLTVVEGR